MYLANLGGTERFDAGGHGLYFTHWRVHRGGGFCFRLARTDNLTKPFIIMRTQWFVIHTLSGQEQKVKDSIEKRIKAEEMEEYVKEVLVPMEKVVEVRNQK